MVLWTFILTKGSSRQGSKLGTDDPRKGLNMLLAIMYGPLEPWFNKTFGGRGRD